MANHFDLMRSSDDVGHDWFAQIAPRLLFETDFVVAGKAHALKEIEFYYDGPGHEDPFAHGEDVQKTFGRWYFHQEGGGYRGGSFKGLDISFGPEGVVGGILIRTIETPEGELVNGCSLCVDHMLSMTKKGSVADLDGVLGENEVWEGGLISLAPRDVARHGEVYATARVGLTLKRMRSYPTMPEYLMARYRFVSDPTIKKGKLHTIISMHQDGLDANEIARRTSSRAHTIRRQVDAHTEGEALTDFTKWSGKKLSSTDLCQIHGLWRKTYAGCSREKRAEV